MVAFSFIVQEPSGIIEVRERQVARLEPLHVAQHLVLGVVAVEDRVGEEGARAARAAPGTRRRPRPPARPRRSGAARRRRRRRAAPRTSAACVVSSSAMPTRSVVVGAQVDPPRARRAPATARRRAARRATRSVSKNGASADGRARGGAGPRASSAASAWTRRAMRAQPVGPVVDGVHAGHHREQHLRGADVARGLLAADVLLARLQRQAVARACRRRPARRRRCGPASGACTRRAWRGTPRAGRRSPAARRSAAWSRRRCRRRTRPAAAAASARAGRPRPRRARPRRARARRARA